MKTKDKNPKLPTAAERKVMQDARDKRAVEWAAIRLRVLGPPQDPIRTPLTPPESLLGPLAGLPPPIPSTPEAQ